MAMTEMNYMSSGGYQMHKETVVVNTINQQVTVNCGFQPKLIFMHKEYSGTNSRVANKFMGFIYDAEYADDAQLQFYNLSGTDVVGVPMPSGGSDTIGSVTATGFTATMASSSNWYGTYYITCYG